MCILENKKKKLPKHLNWLRYKKSELKNINEINISRNINIDYIDIILKIYYRKPYLVLKINWISGNPERCLTVILKWTFIFKFPAASCGAHHSMRNRIHKWWASRASDILTNTNWLHTAGGNDCGALLLRRQRSIKLASLTCFFLTVIINAVVDRHLFSFRISVSAINKNWFIVWSLMICLDKAQRSALRIPKMLDVCRGLTLSIICKKTSIGSQSENLLMKCLFFHFTRASHSSIRKLVNINSVKDRFIFFTHAHTYFKIYHDFNKLD